MLSEPREIAPPHTRTTRMSVLGLLSLIRPVNAVVAFVGIAAACVIAGAGPAQWATILLASLAGMLAGAAGNIINDVYDVAIDRINKPQRAIPSGAVTRKEALLWAAGCMAASLLLSIPLGALPLLIVAGSGVLMYAYSARLKRTVLIGNVAVGLLTGAAFLFGAVTVGNPVAGIIPAAFAFTFNLAREILKDIEDMHGDHANSVVTFPIHVGARTAMITACTILLVVILGTAIPVLLDVYHPVYAWVVFFGVDCVLIYALISLWNDRSTGNIARISALLKFDMLAGIAAILLGSVFA